MLCSRTNALWTLRFVPAGNRLIGLAQRAAGGAGLRERTRGSGRRERDDQRPRDDPRLHGKSVPKQVLRQL
jgi:hypothetical protein